MKGKGKMNPDIIEKIEKTRSQFEILHGNNINDFIDYGR